MSVTLFRNTLKKNWLLFLIFFCVLSMYSCVMISMYDPESTQQMTQMLNMLPAEVVAAFGMSGTANDLCGYLAGYLYGLLVFAFPMVYAIIISHKLVAKQVDNGSFAYLLSTPNSRAKLVATQGVYGVLSIVFLFIGVSAIGVAMSHALFPQALAIVPYLKLNLLTCFVNCSVFMVSFFFSCVFNESKKALAFGAGIPVGLLLMQMIGGASKELSWLKSSSLYGWYDPTAIAQGNSILLLSLLYIAISVALFIGALLVFKRKRLPL